jgi:DNA-binding IscR family transcriptional regulator
MKLTQNQKTAFKAWFDADHDFGVLSFNTIALRSGLPRNLVRRTVRALARRGLTQYERGCWTMDGEPAGSGYRLTEYGRSVLQEVKGSTDDRKRDQSG